jgi:hypothetical protein
MKKTTLKTLDQILKDQPEIGFKDSLMIMAIVLAFTAMAGVGVFLLELLVDSIKSVFS